MKQKNIVPNIFVYFMVFLLMAFSVHAYASPAPVNLGTAGDFVILADTGISTTGTTSITGDIGTGPEVTSTAITGFGLILDSSNQFATSSLVNGKVYARDYAVPTPTKMNTASLDMMTAYTNANGLAADVTGLGVGDIGGMTLAPGVYKWSTGVLIPSDVTLSGNSNDVWVFQIAGTLGIASGKHVLLGSSAQAKNIFWVVADTTTLGTTSDFKGNILDAKTIMMQDGATLNGRALSQTDVTLIGDDISSSDVSPLPIPEFGLIVGGIALIGAIAGIAIIRKRN